MTLHFQRRMRIERIHTPFHAAKQIRLAIAVEVCRPGIGAMDRESDRFAITAQLSWQIKDGFGLRARIQQ
jgi:hypothetical protein